MLEWARMKQMESGENEKKNVYMSASIVARPKE